MPATSCHTCTCPNKHARLSASTTLLLRLFVCMLAIGLCFTAQLQATADETELRDYNTVKHFDPPHTLDAWKARAKDLKLQMQVSLGLYPMPELSPVQPNIYGRQDFDGYTIEKVTFESLPGLVVTGNLYRPKAESPNPAPAILCPHGHWSDARFYEASDSEVRKLLATGAERFRNAARNHIQARCVHLARMGCVVFHWDMLGYCDSQQLSYARTHRWGIGENTNPAKDPWLLFSAQAESRLQSVPGLQALATRRAVDMLLTLPNIDPERIAITGASGGGTQSFLGAALDERIRFAFPAVMVSTGMQGGCTCENACLLRNGTVNVEMAALIAPRPMGLTAADDWTRTMPVDGFPELKELYKLFGKEKNVALFPALHFGHNFNHVSRVAMYGWMNDHLQLGQEKPVLECDFELATKSQLSVWDEEHPLPPSGMDFERQLLRLWHHISEGQLTGLSRGDQKQRAQALTILKNGWRVVLGATSKTSPKPLSTHKLPDSQAVVMEHEQFGEWRLVPRPTEFAGAPESPQDSNTSKATSHQYDLQYVAPLSARDIAISVEGKEAYIPLLAGRVTTPQTDQKDDAILLDIAKQRLVENPRPAAAYTYGYNDSLFTRRAQQLASTLAWTAAENPGKKLVISAQGSHAALALAATAFLTLDIEKGAKAKGPPLLLNLDLDGFQFSNISDIRSPDFVPGSAKYLDVAGLIATLDNNVAIEFTGQGNDELRNAIDPLRRVLRATVEFK